MSRNRIRIVRVRTKINRYLSKRLSIDDAETKQLERFDSYTMCSVDRDIDWEGSPPTHESSEINDEFELRPNKRGAKEHTSPLRSRGDVR